MITSSRDKKCISHNRRLVGKCQVRRGWGGWEGPSSTFPLELSSCSWKSQWCCTVSWQLWQQLSMSNSQGRSLFSGFLRDKSDVQTIPYSSLYWIITLCKLFNAHLYNLKYKLKTVYFLLSPQKHFHCLHIEPFTTRFNFKQNSLLLLRIQLINWFSLAKDTLYP